MDLETLAGAAVGAGIVLLYQGITRDSSARLGLGVGAVILAMYFALSSVSPVCTSRTLDVVSQNYACR